MRKSDREWPLSRTPDWLCPQCRAPLAVEHLIFLRCPECRFIHKGVLSLKETVQVLGVSVKEVEKMIEREEIRIRVQIDSIGRLRSLYVDTLSLWQCRSNTRSSKEQ